MAPRALALLVTLSTPILAGCFSTVRITRAPLGNPGDPSNREDKKTELNGIPFYVKKGICKQESVWDQPVFILIYGKATNLKYTAEAKPGEQREPLKPILESSTKVLSLSQFVNTAEVARLRAKLSKSGAFTQAEVDEMDRWWDVIAKLTDYVPLQEKEETLVASSNAVLVSNAATPESVGDYSRVYYYDARRPWVGSSQLNVKLNADGTLTEASAQVESKTLASILDFIPAKDLIGVAAGAGAAKFLEAHPKAIIESIKLELHIKQEDFQHRHTRYVTYESPCKIAAGGVTSDYALKIEGLSSGNEKEEGGNTVEVTGKIKLPSSEKQQKK